MTVSTKYKEDSPVRCTGGPFPVPKCLCSRMVPLSYPRQYKGSFLSICYLTMAPKIKGLEIPRLCSPMGHKQQSGQGLHHRAMPKQRCVGPKWLQSG